MVTASRCFSIKEGTKGDHFGGETAVKELIQLKVKTLTFIIFIHNFQVTKYKVWILRSLNHIQLTSLLPGTSYATSEMLEQNILHNQVNRQGIFIFFQEDFHK